MDQIGVLADPAQPGLFRQRFFQNRGAISKGSITEGADEVLDPPDQRLQAISEYLVIVPSERVTRYECLIGLFKTRNYLCPALWQVVHANTDDSDRTRQQLIRAATPGAMAGHVVQFTVETVIQPLLQAFFGLSQINIANA